MKNTKDNEGDNYWLDQAKSFLSDFAKKASREMLSRAKKQWNNFLFKAKSEAIAIIMSLIGLIFVMVGLAIFLNSILIDTPGIGFVFVGVVLVLVGWIANLIKKIS